jgi:hypothetical protein
MKRFLLLSALVLSLTLNASADPWRKEVNRLSDRKEKVIETLRRKTSDGTIIAVRTQKGKRTALRVYRLSSKKARLLHMEPGFGKEITFASIHKKGGIPDLAGDGSNILAYHAIHRSLKQNNLVVLRYADGVISRLRDFPKGAFVSIGKKTRIEEKSRPLGRFFSVTCEETFRSPAENAYRTRLYGWEKGSLTTVSNRHKKYLNKKISSLNAKVNAVDIRKTDNYANYLGNALSLFYLYEETGQKHRGWNRFVELFPLRRSDRKIVRKCFKKLRSELKEQLDIPSDW